MAGDVTSISCHFLFFEYLFASMIFFYRTSDFARFYPLMNLSAFFRQLSAEYLPILNATCCQLRSSIYLNLMIRLKLLSWIDCMYSSALFSIFRSSTRFDSMSAFFFCNSASFCPYSFCGCPLILIGPIVRSSLVPLTVSQTSSFF